VILNRGVSGEMAEDTAERIRSEVALRDPDLVLWQLGTNDALARIPPQDFEDTVRPTIRWLKENGSTSCSSGAIYRAPRPGRELCRDTRQPAENRGRGKYSLRPPLR
jgi:lysophospholipase L1-like esterase